MAASPLLFLEKSFASFLANAWFVVRFFSFVEHANLVVFPDYSFVSTKVFYISCFLNSLSSKIIMVWQPSRYIQHKWHPLMPFEKNGISQKWHITNTSPKVDKVSLIKMTHFAKRGLKVINLFLKANS